MQTDEKQKDQVFDPSHVATCVKNIYAGLNKGCNKGAYDLREAGQLCQDLDYVASVLGQLMKQQEKTV